MRLRDHIPPGALLPGASYTALEDAVTGVTRALASAAAVADADGLVRDVLAREAESDTVVGRGVAVPHVRTARVTHLHLAVATLDRPLLPEGGGDPVDLLFVIVVPEHEPRLMLRVLARLGRLMEAPGFLSALRRARTPEELLSAFPED
jgi:PTS system fructose-specific IIC component